MRQDERAPAAATGGAGRNGRTLEQDNFMIAHPPPIVNPDLLTRYREYQVLSSAVDICIARLEHPDADPEDCRLLRRLASLFAEHGLASEKEHRL